MSRWSIKLYYTVDLYAPRHCGSFGNWVVAKSITVGLRMPVAIIAMFQISWVGRHSHTFLGLLCDQMKAYFHCAKAAKTQNDSNTSY